MLILGQFAPVGLPVGANSRLGPGVSGTLLTGRQSQVRHAELVLDGPDVPVLLDAPLPGSRSRSRRRMRRRRRHSLRPRCRDFSPIGRSVIYNAFMQQSNEAVSKTQIDARSLTSKPDLRVAAKALISRSSDDLLLVRRSFSTESANSLKYSPPGGTVEPGESLTAALKREMSEETGLDVSVGDIFGVTEWAVPWRNAYYIGLFFICYLRTAKPVICLSAENSEYIWCTLADLPKLDIMQGSHRIVSDYLTSSVSNLIVHANHESLDM